MIGTIIGDVVGSRFEWDNIKTKQFDMFVSGKCRPTDDSIMTLAIAKSILACDGDYTKLSESAVHYMQMFGRKYPRAGYGGSFWRWIMASTPQPYNSWGNGAAMRVSPCGYAAASLEEAITLSNAVTKVTHNHPEGLKGAEAVAVAIYMALHGRNMAEIKNYINRQYYSLDFTLDDIRPTYSFDVSCQGSVPQAFVAFFESTDFEEAICNAISIGGDSDTIAAITGGIAEAYYGVPANIRNLALPFLDEYQLSVLNEFENAFR